MASWRKDHHPGHCGWNNVTAVRADEGGEVDRQQMSGRHSSGSSVLISLVSPLLPFSFERPISE